MNIQTQNNSWEQIKTEFLKICEDRPIGIRADGRVLSYDAAYAEVFQLATFEKMTAKKIAEKIFKRLQKKYDRDNYQ